MIVVVCLPCELALRIMPARAADANSDAELETLVGRRSAYWPDKYPCPGCTKPATGMRETQADPRVLQVMKLHDLTPLEAYAAFHGLGLPGEQACTFEMIQELLLTHPVRRVVGRTIADTAPARSVIDHIELWDGTRVHLAAGLEGAVVYRVVRPTSYAAAVLTELEGVSR